MEKEQSVLFYDRKKTIYIIGPMRGMPYFNFPAFDAKRDELKAEGWDVISPADLDRRVGFDGCELPESTDWNEIPEGFDMLECVRRDARAILSLRPGRDAVYVLPGKRGAGSEAELKLAVWMRLEIHYSEQCTCREAGVFESQSPFGSNENNPETFDGNQEMRCAADLLDEAKRLVCSDRNKSYGTPDDDFGRTAAMWTGYLQDILRSPIKSNDVAWMMAMLKASRSRHAIKRDNYVDAAGYLACGWKCVEKYQ
jgi:hypothetical protein